MNVPNLRTVQLMLMVLIVPLVESLIAYDCGHKSMNYTKISLSIVDSCNFTDKVIVQKTETVQLVEIKQDYSVDVLSCEVKIFRHVTKCQMASYALTNAIAEYVQPLSRDKCLKAHSTGHLEILHGGNKMIIFRDMEPNKSYKHHQTFTGWTDQHGYCDGASFSDPFGTYEKVVVTGWVKAILSKGVGHVLVASNTIRLSDNTKHRYDIDHTTSNDLGNSYWENKPLDSCDSLIHSVLYEGPATVSSETGSSAFMRSIVSVSSDSLLFSLAIRKPYKICNMDAYRTEHPRLIIVRQTGHGFYYKMSKKRKPGDLDLLTYMNSKFVVLERNTVTNMQNLYRDVREQRCNQELEIIKTQLSLATIAPIEFAYTYTNQAGYTGTVLGEVIYITKCQAVVVEIRRTEKCYHELPVTYSNQSYFMLPRSHLLQLHGQEVTCNPIFAPTYEIDNAWYGITRTPVEVKTPHILSPSKKGKWIYKSPANLASSGIYSQDDLEGLREHIMYGTERTAIQNVISRSFTGFDPDLQGGSLMNMVDDNAFERLTDSLSAKFWGWMQIFGNLSAGFIGLFIIARIVKFIIDTVIHGTTLYEIYGRSMWLIGSLWDSVTLCLISRHHMDKGSDKQTSVKTDNNACELEAIMSQDTTAYHASSAPGHLYPVVNTTTFN